MSLNGIVSKDLAEKLADLSVDDFVALTKASSLGFNPCSLHTAVQGIARDEDVALPEPSIGPHPLVVQAWSFVKDHGQYHDTYGLSSSAAGELLDLLKTDADKGVAEIQRIVTEALRRKGSNRAVVVNRNGMPGGASQGALGGGQDERCLGPQGGDTSQSGDVRPVFLHRGGYRPFRGHAL
nr:putative PAS-rich protein [Metarhizium brunneum polymycovirus 1]